MFPTATKEFGRDPPLDLISMTRYVPSDVPSLRQGSGSEVVAGVPLNTRTPFAVTSFFTGSSPLQIRLVPSLVPLLYQSGSSSSVRNATPCRKGVRFRGKDPYEPGKISLTLRVPSVVPLLTHSSNVLFPVRRLGSRVSGAKEHESVRTTHNIPWCAR